MYRTTNFNQLSHLEKSYGFLKPEGLANVNGSCRVPVRVSHVAIGKSSKELAKPNLWILANLAKSINSSNWEMFLNHCEFEIKLIIGV